MPEPVAPGASSVIGFDHLMVVVDDLAAAAGEATAAGFSVTPPSLMPGLANRLVCFADAVPGATSFIEFLEITDVAKAPPKVLDALGRAPGPRALVVAVQDTAAYGAHLDRLAIAHATPLTVRRQWVVSDGETLDVHLEIVLAEPAGLPVPVIAVRHHTPQHYLRAEFVTHPNGATAMPAIRIGADDPVATASAFGRLLGVPVASTPEGLTVELPGSRLLVCSGRPGILGADISGAAALTTVAGLPLAAI